MENPEEEILLNALRIKELLSGLDNKWKLVDNKLEKELTFKNFSAALNFVNQLGILAETENHHPDIFISYNKVKLSLFTHKVGGLTVADFILAERIGNLY